MDLWPGGTHFMCMLGSVNDLLGKSFAQRLCSKSHARYSMHRQILIPIFSLGMEACGIMYWSITTCLKLHLYCSSLPTASAIHLCRAGQLDQWVCISCVSAHAIKGELIESHIQKQPGSWQRMCQCFSIGVGLCQCPDMHIAANAALSWPAAHFHHACFVSF